MFDGEDHDGKPCVQCVACLLLQIGEVRKSALAIEQAYLDNLKSCHNYEHWDPEHWDRIEIAKAKLEGREPKIECRRCHLTPCQCAELFAEKPKSDCRPDCRLCKDAEDGHGCSCHTEKRNDVPPGFWKVGNGGMI